MAEDETAETTELLALYRRQQDAGGDDGEAGGELATAGFGAARRAGGDALRRMLTARLARQADVGQSLYADHGFLDALRAALWALRAPATAGEGETLRAEVLAAVLQALHSQSVPAGVSSAASDVLLRELRHLRDADLPPVVDELLRGVSLCQQAQHQRRADGLAIFHTLELLPQLLLRVASCPVVVLPDTAYDVPERCSGGEYSAQAMRKLVALAWPKRLFLQFLKTFREFPLTEAQEREVCAKVFREANAEVGVRSTDRRASNFELLPTVFHNVLLLALRVKSAVCRRMLVHMLVEQCRLLASEASAQTDGSADAGDTMRPRSHSVRDVRALQSTILYHLDMILKQDASVGKLFLVEYEVRTSVLSSFDVAALLTIASGPHGARVTSFLSQHIVRSFAEDLASGNANSSPAAAARGSISRTVRDAVDGSWSSVTPRMVSFAFQLMEVQDKKAEELLENSAVSQKASHLPWVSFGIRLLIDCFRSDESVRERIIDTVMNCVIVQSPRTKVALLLLARIVQRHALDINGALGVRVREGFEYLIHMSPMNARLFLAALGPLLKAQPNMKGFLILTLRKAMFRKDAASRTIGIQGFSSLLCLFSQVFKRGTLTQLYSQNTGALLSQSLHGSTQLALSAAAVESQSDAATQEQSTAIVAEDLFRQFCGVFKRALQLQTAVRLVLYAELLRVFRECPSLRPPILELVFRHFSKYYDANETVLPPLKLNSCTGAQRQGAYDEPLAFLVHTLVVCVEETRQEGVADDAMMGDDLLPATQTPVAQRSFGMIDKNVSVLMERMKRCEITDFDLDKHVSFAPSNSLGAANRQLSRTLCEVLEACMNWVVVSAAPSGGLDQRSWDALAHYLHLHQWVLSRLGEGDAEGVGKSKEGRKRGRPAGKGKQRSTTDGDQQADRSASSSPAALDNGAVFREHAGAKDAHLLTLFSIVVFMDAAARKVEADSLALTKDEELLLLFVLDRASRTAGFVQDSSVGEFQLLSRGASLSSDSKEFIDHLGPALFGIASSLDDSDDRTSVRGGGAGPTDRERLERLGRIRCSSLRTFAVVVELWMTRSMEQATDCIAGVFRASSGGLDAGREDEEDDFGRVSSSVRLERYTLKFCTLFDSLVGKEAVDEASAVLDIIKTLWLKLPADVLSRFDVWMESALTRRKFSTQKLLEKMVLLFLRPQAQRAMNFSMALRIANGLFHRMNEEPEIPFPVKTVDFELRLDLSMLDKKNVATAAGAVLTKAEQTIGDLEPRVKEFCAQELRQVLKMKEEEVHLLQAFEDENGFSALNMKDSAMQYHAAFKGHCRRVFELAGVFMPLAMMEMGKAALSLRVVRLVGRLYKVLVALITCRLRRKEATLPRYLHRLFDRTAGELAPLLLQFIACIHEAAKRATATKARKNSSAPTAAQSKLIPDVIFQMEQFDLALIRLSKLCKDRDFSQWCKLRQSRDFRFNQKGIHDQRKEDRAMDKGYRDQADEEGEEDALLGDSVRVSDPPTGFDEERAADSGAEATESAEYEEEGEDEEETEDEPQSKRVRGAGDGDAA